MNILITQVVTYEKKKGFIFSLSKDWIDYASKIGLNLIPYNYNFKKSKLDKIKIVWDNAHLFRIDKKSKFFLTLIILNKIWSIDNANANANV